MKEYKLYECQGIYSLAVLADDECILFVSDQWKDGAASILKIKQDLEAGECDILDVVGSGVADDPQACYDDITERLDDYYERGRWTELREIDEDDIREFLKPEEDALED